MAWTTELVDIVRQLVDDVNEPQSFSDDRLQSVLLVAAQYVTQDVDLTTTYTVDVDALSLSPDPTTSSPKDNVMINLMCLKAGCIIERAQYKEKARNGGILIKDGQSTIDTRGIAEQFKVILEKGLCKEYEQAKQDYQLGSVNPGRSILSPSSGPNLPDMRYDYYYRER